MTKCKCNPDMHVPCLQVVIGPSISLPEGSVVSMHHPEEVDDEDDDDEFLSDDRDVGNSKDKTKQKSRAPHDTHVNVC